MFYASRNDEAGERAVDEKLAAIAIYPGKINELVLMGFRTYVTPDSWGPVIHE